MSVAMKIWVWDWAWYANGSICGNLSLDKDSNFGYMFPQMVN